MEQPKDSLEQPKNVDRSPATICYTAAQVKALRFLKFDAPNQMSVTAMLPFANTAAASSVMRSLERRGIVGRIPPRDEWSSITWFLIEEDVAV